MQSVFLAGPWADPQLCAQIAGKDVPRHAATLPGHGLRIAPDGILPQIVARNGADLRAARLELDAAAFDTFAALHAAFGAAPVTFEISVEGRDVAAAVFMPDVPPEGTDWHPQDWHPAKATVISAALCELAALARTRPVDALRARWQMALSHAASRRRARLSPAPATQRGAWGPDDVNLVRQSQPYAWFFGVREDDLHFRRFDGRLSPEVKRAGFVMSDAVTVLPYDPVRDRVMVIEQFRYGPWLRGDPNPWSLEPIAGRVDPFETPADTALREALEEARLTLHADGLRSVGHVYPSPGAITEFLYQYVALCDLPDGLEGVAGLDSEAENIRSHVISFEQLLSLVLSGEVQNGPLVLTTWWLAAHRAGLRVAGKGVGQ